MIALAALFASSIVVDRYFGLPFYFWIATACLSFLAWLAIWISQYGQRFAWIALFTVIVSSGGLWHHVRWNLHSHDHIGLYRSEESNPSVALGGTVISEPVVVALPPHDPRLDTVAPTQRVRFDMSISSLGDGIASRRCRGIVRVFLELPADAIEAAKVVASMPVCGTEIEAIGSLSFFRPPTNPGGFNFAMHFRGQQRFASIYLDSPEAICISKEPGTAMRLRARVRESIDTCLHRYVARPHAGFASAVLLGNRDQMELDTRTRFMKTGASHLLAISGLHVGILASSFLILMRLGWLSRRNCLVATMLFVAAYSWLVEFRPTVVRASILICVMCIARLLGRKALSWSSLATALMLVLILNPADLFGLGPQLSFIAISSIIMGAAWIHPPQSDDPIDQLIRRTRSNPVRIFNGIMRKIRATFCVSLLIWVLGLPLVAARFHLVAWIAPLLNPLVLLPMACALYFGMATLSLAWISPPLAVTTGLGCCFFLGCIQFVIDSGAWLGCHQWVHGPSDLAVIVFYVGIFALAAVEATKAPARWRVAFVAGWFVFGWLVPNEIQRLQKINAGQLEVIIINVRHGSAALVRTPDGANILVDGGSLSGSHRAAATIADVLHHQRIDRLDVIVASHADVDHFNGIPELTSRFAVGELWTTEMMKQDSSDSVNALMEAISRHEIKVRTVSRGDQGSFSNCELKVLGPGVNNRDAWKHLGDNELSVVLSIEYRGKKILLPGDLEKFGLESLLSRDAIDVDVLVAPHHGSKNSSPTRVAAWCTPEYVVASCGARKVGKLEKDLFTRGHPAKILTTHQDGAVRVLVSNDGELDVHRWDRDCWTPVER